MKLTLLLITCVAMPVYASLNDIFPADYTPLPGGTMVATGYFYDKSARGPYLNGKEVAHWPGSVQNTVLRFSRYAEINGMTVAGTTVISYGHQKITGDSVPENYNREASGLGDIGLHATVWPINDPQTGNSLALHAAWILPSGQYQSGHFLNIGSNRQQSSLSAGWIHRLNESWTTEVMGELGWYGSNEAFGVAKQNQNMEKTYSATSYLRYHFGLGREVYIGYQWNGGGETSINGISNNDPFQYEKAMLGFIYPVSASHLINFRLGQDLNMQNGFAMEREMVVRWLFVF